MRRQGTTEDWINYLKPTRRDTMLDALRPFFSRLIAPAITALLAILATKFGIDFGADAAQHLTAYATVIAFAVFTAVNGVFHRVIDKKVNPGDAASSHLAGAEKTESKQLKAGGE